MKHNFQEALASAGEHKELPFPAEEFTQRLDRVRQAMATAGIDLLFALDSSKSMLAEDIQPNRLEAAKEVAAQFVQGRRNDRIGLVAFAGEAYTQAPLTLDYSVIVNLLSELDVGMIEDGTAVGMGLATAVKRLQASDAESKPKD